MMFSKEFANFRQAGMAENYVGDVHITLTTDDLGSHIGILNPYITDQSKAKITWLVL